ncbi:hypothetical protein INT45_013262 [Circinella minor]|uniref:Mitochondrial adapter protein MCP1 transmembrane domain-containing protein n=1 Tax=Circinella minor TaxID=1195481 RepID=A0A8H7S5G6_9FUNG|nr:hypothetical protein INT45_013262 [Circinella minor]
MVLYKTYGILTTIQSASAVAFSSFIFVHGSQIALANVGGPDMTNRWLLLGRPFYQDEHTEGLVVTGAITVHVVSGLAKAAIRQYWQGQRKKQLNKSDNDSNEDINTILSVNNKKNTNGLLSYHNVTGYFLIPLCWIHYRLVRELPVKVFGDSSMLDVGIVAWGLQNWPLFTYTVHGALIGTAAYHIISGGATAYQRTFTRKRNSGLTTKKNDSSIATTKKNKKITVIATTGIVLLSGLIIIGRCTQKIPLRNEYASIYSMIFSTK